MNRTDLGILIKRAYLNEYGQEVGSGAGNTLRNVALGTAGVGAAALGFRYRKPIMSALKGAKNFLKGPGEAAAKGVNQGTAAGAAPKAFGAGQSSISNPALAAKQQAAFNAAAGSNKAPKGSKVFRVKKASLNYHYEMKKVANLHGVAGNGNSIQPFVDKVNKMKSGIDPAAPMPANNFGNINSPDGTTGGISTQGLLG